MMLYKALSIAGFDGSGGAGIQADLKTFSAFGCYGMTVLTALPVQNTCGVKTCYAIPPQAVLDQLETIFEDIRPDSIKIGMLFSAPIIELVANFLAQNAKGIPLVLDPVLVAKSGDALLLPDALAALKTLLFPLATVITPNLPEAEALLETMPINNAAQMPEVASQLLNIGCQSVLLKGGHLEAKDSSDFLLTNKGEAKWFSSDRITSKNTHGTGCTLSAAIASGLALKLDLLEACRIAKWYVSSAIKAAKADSVGKGRGPVHHFYHLWPTLEKVTTQVVLEENPN